MTMARTIRLYRLPAEPATKGLRPMTAADVPAVTRLLNAHLARFSLTQHFSEEEVQHWCADGGMRAKGEGLAQGLGLFGFVPTCCNTCKQCVYMPVTGHVCVRQVCHLW